MKTYAIFRNGTQQGSVDAENIKEARDKVFAAYGTKSLEIVEDKPYIDVACYIYNTYNERGMKTFEKKVKGILKSHNIFGEIICQNAYLERVGKGAYNKVAKIKIDYEEFTLKSFTHDSELWDNWENTTKSKRALFLAILEEEIDSLILNLN